MDDTSVHGLNAWVTRRRWFAGSSGPRFRRVADIRLDDRFRTLLLVDDADPRGFAYQVPLADVEASGGVAIGEVDGRLVADACEHPAFGAVMLRAMGRPGHGTTRILGADQSNTTLVVAPRAPGEPEVALKLFRTVRHGPNPDAEIAEALAGRGAPVPTHLGSLSASWPDAEGSVAEGHLAIAQRLIAGAGDAWRAAVLAAREGDAFRSRAHRLGAATARLHAALADVLPTVEPLRADIDEVVASWHRRAEDAVHAVPALAAQATAIHARLDAVDPAGWPPLQRIHGDLHLGQILEDPGSSDWWFIDFEGEPLRSLAERRRPAPALQDVAGMLRSFHYAAAAGRAGIEWAEQCAREFIAGYEDVCADSITAHGRLLHALVLDKALYEARYEALYRPDFLPIPLEGIQLLLAT